MRWFGESWGAPVNEPGIESMTPIGTRCGVCRQEIEAWDRGFLVPAAGDLEAIEAEELTAIYVMSLGPPGCDVPHLPYHGDCFLKMTGVPASAIPVRNPAKESR
jgi:hypothetical protein